MLKFSEIQEFKKELLERWQPGDEICGVITSAGTVEERENLSPEPAHRFEFHPSALEDAAATWHTHPSGDANLSTDDYHFFKSWPNQTHFTISRDEVRCYIVLDDLVYFIEQEKDHPTWPLGREVSS